MSWPPSASRRSSSRDPRSRVRGSTRRNGSGAPSSSSCPPSRASSPGWMTRPTRRRWPRPHASSRASLGRPPPSACSRRSCSPTSSARPSWRRRLGDTAWRELLGRHHAIVRRELARYQGRELDTAGDGFFAAFDGPARAVQAAAATARATGRHRPRGARRAPYRGVRGQRRQDRRHRGLDRRPDLRRWRDPARSWSARP